MKYAIEVDAPGLSPESFEVSPGAGTIGSGEGDVVFVHPGAGLGPRAIKIDVGESGVEMTAEPGVRLTQEGKPCEAIFVAWGEEVYADNVCFTLLAKEGANKSTSPLVWVLVVLLALLGVGVALPEMDADSYEGGAPVRHEFVEPASAPCPASNPEKALMVARETEHLARAKMERYPFDPSEGPRALLLLSKQVSCLETAGEHEASQQGAQTLRDWVDRLDRDQSVLETTLFRHQEEGRSQEALLAVQALEMLVSLSAAEPAPKYLTWLQSLKKDLQWRVASK